MTDHERTPARPGDTLHVLSGGVLAFGVALRRGDTIKLTAGMVESTLTVDGHSWLDDISTEGQTRRWGEVRFGIGPWPQDLPKWLKPGDATWLDAYNDARQDAYNMPTAAARDAALAELRTKFGDALQTSRTLRSVR